MSLFKNIGRQLKSRYTDWGKPNHGLTGGLLTRKQFKKLRSKLGLTSKNSWIRSLRRQINGGSVVSSSQPVSAGSVYQHNARTLSQLTGGA